MTENLFLAGKHANFYQVYYAPQETRFRIEPRTDADKSFVEQMNGALNLLEQHMRFRQYKPESFIPRVVNFDAKTGRLVITISASLTSAVPTVSIDYSNMIIDCQDATWITKQAFQLASLAHGAGIVLPFSTANFLVCYQSQSFMLLDWTMAQIYKDRMDETVVKEQVIELAELLLIMVDYAGVVSGGKPKNCYLSEFMNKAANGAFVSTTEALKELSGVLG